MAMKSPGRLVSAGREGSRRRGPVDDVVQQSNQKGKVAAPPLRERRYPARPRPPKPSANMTQVEGSGMADEWSDTGVYAGTAGV